MRCAAETRRSTVRRRWLLLDPSPNLDLFRGQWLHPEAERAPIIAEVAEELHMRNGLLRGVRAVRRRRHVRKARRGLHPVEVPLLLLAVVVPLHRRAQLRELSRPLRRNVCVDGGADTTTVPRRAAGRRARGGHAVPARLRAPAPRGGVQPRLLPLPRGGGVLALVRCA